MSTSAAGSKEERSELIPFTRFEADKGMKPKKLEEGIQLTSEIRHENWFRTRSKFSPPFKATVVAKTDSTNIRLLYGEKGRVIFNWELNRAELRLRDIVTGAKFGVKGQGEIPVDTWVTIELTVKADSFSVAVDGKERHQQAGNFKELNAELGIGPAHGSVVTMKSFAVEKL